MPISKIQKKKPTYATSKNEISEKVSFQCSSTSNFTCVLIQPSTHKAKWGAKSYFFINVHHIINYYVNPSKNSIKLKGSDLD